MHRRDLMMMLLSPQLSLSRIQTKDDGQRSHYSSVGRRVEAIRLTIDEYLQLDTQATMMEALMHELNRRAPRASHQNLLQPHPNLDSSTESHLTLLSPHHATRHIHAQDLRA